MNPTRRTHLLSLAFLLGVTACGGPGRHMAPEPIEPLPTADASLRATRLELGDNLPVEVLRVPGSMPQPVVVYLPGLGQSEMAGQRWKWAWALAGYAVVSLQPLPEDQNAWRSELARTGEFAELGRLHYGPELRALRRQALLDALAQLRAPSHPLAKELDWSRVVVAGYETGGQTALDLASTAPPTGWRPQGVLSISPQPTPAPSLGVAPPAPPSLTLPALLISSQADHDPLSLLRQPEQRLTAVDTTGALAHWVLLHGATHAGLAGTLPNLHEAEQDVRRGVSRGGGGGGGGEGGGGRRGRGGGGGGGGGMYGEGGAAGLARGGLRSGSASEAARADLQLGLHTSLDFLAAVLRGDAAAQARVQALTPPRFEPAPGDTQRRGPLHEGGERRLPPPR